MSLVEAIQKAGLWDEGYCIQQDPEEFAELVECLKAREPFRSCLAIGIAAGGVERFLIENVKIERLCIMDDGKHPNHKVWEEGNKQAVNRRIVGHYPFIGDSHSDAAGLFLAGLGTSFDLVGIDGDHSPQGVAQDWEKVRHYLIPGAIVWFHDIHVSEAGQTGARKLWARLKTEYEVVLETNGQFGIGVIRV